MYFIHTISTACLSILEEGSFLCWPSLSFFYFYFFEANLWLVILGHNCFDLTLLPERYPIGLQCRIKRRNTVHFLCEWRMHRTSKCSLCSAQAIYLHLKQTVPYGPRSVGNNSWISSVYSDWNKCPITSINTCTWAHSHTSVALKCAQECTQPYPQIPATHVH